MVITELVSCNKSFVNSEYLMKIHNHFLDQIPLQIIFAHIQGIQVQLLKESSGEQLEQMEFKGDLMEAVVQKFVVENLSQIDLSFNISLQNIEFEQIETSIEKMSIQHQSLKSISQLNIDRRSTGDLSSLSFYSQSTLNQENILEYKQHTQFNFKSVNGQKYQKQIYFTQECQKILQKRKRQIIGAISETSGVLKPKQKTQITLIIFGNASQIHNDFLIFDSPKINRISIPVYV